MEKVKNTLKSVNKFGLLALVLVAFSTMAFTPSKKVTNIKWSFDGTSYHKVPSENYFCDEASNVCTRTYPENQDPNVNASSPISQENGLFTQL